MKWSCSPLRTFLCCFQSQDGALAEKNQRPAGPSPAAEPFYLEPDHGQGDGVPIEPQFFGHSFGQGALGEPGEYTLFQVAETKTLQFFHRQWNRARGNICSVRNDLQRLIA